MNASYNRSSMILNLLRRLYGVYALSLALIILLLIGVPLVLLMPGLNRRRWAGRKAVRGWLWSVGAPLRLRGLAQLPAGPCVVVSNHASYLDGPLLMAALPSRFTFVVQHGAASWPLAGRVIKAMGVRFVERESKRAGAAQLLGLIRRLQDGESLAVFPEGTFNAEPALLKFHGGAFLTAAHAGVPVVPAVIRGSRRFLGDGRLLPSPSRLEIELFAPIQVSGTDRESVARTAAAARAVILRHCGEIDGTIPKPMEYPSPP